MAKMKGTIKIDVDDFDFESPSDLAKLLRILQEKFMILADAVLEKSYGEAAIPTLVFFSPINEKQKPGLITQEQLEEWKKKQKDGQHRYTWGSDAHKMFDEDGSWSVSASTSGGTTTVSGSVSGSISTSSGSVTVSGQGSVSSSGSSTASISVSGSF